MTEQNKEDSNEENRPLTRSDWVMLLSGEINNEERRNSINNTIPIVSLLLAVALSLISIMLAVRTTNLPDADINSSLNFLEIALYIVAILLCIILVWMIFHVFYWHCRTNPKMKTWRKIRSKIIYETLTDYDKIREQCE